MLSKESEKFLREFRIELMTRGKDGTEMKELEEQLRDHLMEAESDSKTLDDVTNGSVENYIDALSREVSLEKNIGRFITQAAFGMFLLFTIPGFLNGTFEFTVSHMIYLLVLFVLGPLAIVAFMKHIIVEHTDFITEKIEMSGYVKLIVASILFMSLLIGGVFLYREFPIYEFLTMEISTMRVIGYVMFVLAIILFIVIKQWIILGTLIAISLPNIIATLFTNGNPDDSTYIMVSGISLFILSILFMTISFFYFRKKESEE